MMNEEIFKQDLLWGYTSVGFDPEAAAHLANFALGTARGIIKHLTENAKANVTSGSSTGLWSIE